MSTTNRKTGVIAQLPRDGKRGVVCSTNGRDEYQLHLASDTRHRGAVVLAVGREVTFGVREALSMHDTPQVRELELAPFEWDVSRDHKAWVVKDRRPVEDPLPAPEVDENEKCIGVIDHAGIGWVNLRDGRKARIRKDITLPPDQLVRFNVGDEVTCEVAPMEIPANVTKRQRHQYEPPDGARFMWIATDVQATGFVVMAKGERLPRDKVMLDKWGNWHIRH